MEIKHIYLECMVNIHLQVLNLWLFIVPLSSSLHHSYHINIWIEVICPVVIEDIFLLMEPNITNKMNHFMREWAVLHIF